MDERLNVYGVKNLKIAGTCNSYFFHTTGGLFSTLIDLSIMPENVGSNTYNTALAIGEKAAVIIAQDLGIFGVTET